MTTFLEFYMALLRFINFKLFTDLGFKQPPSVTEQLYLDVPQVREMQKQARKKFE